jgi:hypothetical protein
MDFPYFAMQNGEECRCDYSFGTPSDSYPRISDTECDKDGKGKYMGAGWANSVFRNEEYTPADGFYGPGLHTWDD